MMIDCKLEQEENAELWIDVTLAGTVYAENRCFTGKQRSISKFLVKRIPFIEEKCKLPQSALIAVKLEQ